MLKTQWIVLAGLMLTHAVSATADPAGPVTSPPVLQVESPYSFEDTVRNLRRAIGGSNFRMIREQAWDYGLETADKGERDAILYFCNFDMVNEAIKIDTRVGQFLPCRVTVAEQDGKVLVMAVNPEPIGQVLGNDKLKPICNRVTELYEDLIDEAIL